MRLLKCTCSTLTQAHSKRHGILRRRHRPVHPTTDTMDIINLPSCSVCCHPRLNCWPLGYAVFICIWQFQLHTKEEYSELFLRTCCQVNAATKPHCWLVNHSLCYNLVTPCLATRQYWHRYMSTYAVPSHSDLSHFDRIEYIVQSWIPQSLTTKSPATLTCGVSSECSGTTS